MIHNIRTSRTAASRQQVGNGATEAAEDEKESVRRAEKSLSDALFCFGEGEKKRMKRNTHQKKIFAKVLI